MRVHPPYDRPAFLMADAWPIPMMLQAIMRITARNGFFVAAAITLAINIVLFARLGIDCDKNLAWILLNLPGMPCGIVFVLAHPVEEAALALTMLASCAAWGGLGAAVAKGIQLIQNADR